MKKKISVFMMTLLLILNAVFVPELKTYASGQVTLSSAVIANYFNSKVGTSVPKASCLAFIADGFEALGATRSSANCAYEYGTSHIVSTSMDNIPVGADVFFLWNSNYTGTWYTCGNHYCHHIAVYVGDGYVVHTSGGTVVKTSLSNILNYWNMDFRGWGYHGNVTISDAPPEDGSRLTGTGASEITNTSARIYTKVTPAGDMTEAGFYLGTSSDNMQKTVENITQKGCTDIWYDLGTGKWTGPLQEGTTYYYQIYAVLGGVTYKSALSTFTTNGAGDLTAPVISNVRVKNLSCGGYTVYCDVTDNVGVQKVAFPTWTVYNGQDDLDEWPSVTTASSGNTYSFQVNSSEHNGEMGGYITHIYAYDQAGNYSRFMVDEQNVNHISIKDSAVPATCISPGKTEGSHCSECGKVLLEQRTVAKTPHNYDAGRITKTATCEEDGVRTCTCTVCGATKTESIPRTDHAYETTVVKATLDRDGKIITACTLCGDVKNTDRISHPADIILKRTSYIYDGEVKRPGVIVEDAIGRTIDRSNYSVHYEKGRENVGKYKVTVTFKGNYSGTKNLSFTIKPSAPKLSSLKVGSRKLTVKWKKQTQATGYELQYSTGRSFAKNTVKTVNIRNKATVNKTIAGLKAKKTYYVRIRAYKTVSGKKYYSSWSSTKKAVTKR